MEAVVGGLAAVPGLSVGEASDRGALTGCTVVLCPSGATIGAATVGFAASTRQFGGTDPLHVVSRAHALLFTGGSAFGLGAAQGVMEHLAERGVGFEAGPARVPVVPTAALFDLSLGDGSIRPGPAMAREACEAAVEGVTREGNVGAGTGSACGKVLGFRTATKTGVGSWAARQELPGGHNATIGALAVVNAFGDVRDPESGRLIAGLRGSPESLELVGTAGAVTAGVFGRPPPGGWAGRSTTLCAVGVDLSLDPVGCSRLARMASAGLYRALDPCGTLVDGDLVVVLATGQGEPIGDLAVGALGVGAAVCVARSIVRGATEAGAAGGLPGALDLVRAC